MESNKEESVKCIRICKDSIAKGSLDRAKRFAEKAERLFPSDEAKYLLKLITDKEQSSQNTNGHTPNGEGLRHRRNSHSRSENSTPTESSSTQKDYTPEQVAAVKKIKASKNYYDTLGLSKDCDDSDLKKAYRKLALQFHPDKNRAPGAAEAFKAIGNAYATLSDSEKRRRYDLYGEEESRSPSRRRHEHFHDDDISPEDIFNMFFGGANGFTTATYNGNRHRRQGRTQFHFQRGGHHREENSFTALLQLSPILIMAILSLFSMIMQEEPPYKLYQTKKYDHPRTTHRLAVQYYVQRDFTKKYYGTSLHKLEREIEQDHVAYLRNECYKEQMLRENLKWRAQLNRDGKAYREAEQMELKSCRRLTALGG